MDSSELDTLLYNHNLTFNWSDEKRTWSLVGQVKSDNSLRRTEPQRADNLQAGQTAAVKFIQYMFRSRDESPGENLELDALLSKYRMTFNWGNPGLKWWLVGQAKGKNSLERSVAQPAANRAAAQDAAVVFIQNMFK